MAHADKMNGLEETGDSETTLRDRALFQSVDHNGDGTVTSGELEETLRHMGLSLKDRRLKGLAAYLKSRPGLLGIKEFSEAVSASNRPLLERAFRAHLVIPEWQSFCKDMARIFEDTRPNAEGKVASYIPQLATVDPEHWAVSFCSVDGQIMDLGDWDLPFGVQSTMKPITYLIALEEKGEDYVHHFVGREPSGRSFNELTLNSDNLPHNPMINSGSIMCCSLVKDEEEQSDRFEHIMDFWQRLAGRKGQIGFSNSMYLSERATADRNFCLGYMMQEKGAFQHGKRTVNEEERKRYARKWDQYQLTKHLELYFQCCSITTRTKDMACVAATLANGGKCPFTDEWIFQPSHVRNALSLMLSCGMYDYSGEWAYKIGLPAKSGVSGAIMLVIPNVGGLALYSPRLDALGNSMRGVEFCTRMAQRFNFHVYDTLNGVVSANSWKKDPRAVRTLNFQNEVVALCFLSAAGDLAGLKALIANGADPDSSDYDGRTPLHLAASEGRLEVVKYLVSRNVSLNPVDRWGGTPLSDANREGKDEVAVFLKKSGALLGSEVGDQPQFSKRRTLMDSDRLSLNSEDAVSIASSASAQFTRSKSPRHKSGDLSGKPSRPQRPDIPPLPSLAEHAEHEHGDPHESPREQQDQSRRHVMTSPHRTRPTATGGVSNTPTIAIPQYANSPRQADGPSYARVAASPPSASPRPKHSPPNTLSPRTGGAGAAVNGAAARATPGQAATANGRSGTNSGPASLNGTARSVQSAGASVQQNGSRSAHPANPPLRSQSVSTAAAAAARPSSGSGRSSPTLALSPRRRFDNMSVGPTHIGHAWRSMHDGSEPN